MNSAFLEKKHILLGVFLIISGGITAYFGLRYSGLPRGITLYALLFFIGIFLMLSGVFFCVGFDVRVCPNCGEEQYFSKIVKNRKCKFCKKPIVPMPESVRPKE